MGLHLLLGSLRPSQEVLTAPNGVSIHFWGPYGHPWPPKRSPMTPWVSIHFWGPCGRPWPSQKVPNDPTGVSIHLWGPLGHPIRSPVIPMGVHPPLGSPRPPIRSPLTPWASIRFWGPPGPPIRSLLTPLGLCTFEVPQVILRVPHGSPSTFGVPQATHQIPVDPMGLHPLLGSLRSSLAIPKGPQ